MLSYSQTNCTVVLDNMYTIEYKEECGTCALIAEGSTMPYSDNTCPQVTHTHTHKHTKHTQTNTHTIYIPVWRGHHPAHTIKGTNTYNQTNKHISHQTQSLKIS